MNTVFQDYALFPHMSVGDNVGYGLMVKRVPRKERSARVAEALEMVRLPGYEKRKPGQLSGGQRQRIALARALVNRPRVLLLDEPLGALDLKLREQMQIELKAIQKDVGITFLFVTHDQDEALTMSDRLAVFSEGRIDQVGSPAEVYENPATAFVAGFVGTSNLISGAVARAITGTDGTFTVRPEKIHLAEPRRAARRRSVHGRRRRLRGRLPGREHALHRLARRRAGSSWWCSRTRPRRRCRRWPRADGMSALCGIGSTTGRWTAPIANPRKGDPGMSKRWIALVAATAGLAVAAGCGGSSGGGGAAVAGGGRRRQHQVVDEDRRRPSRR